MTGFYERLPDGWRRNMDNVWLWLVLAYIALAALTIWLAVVNANTAATAAKNTQVIATQRAAARASYNDCVRSRPYLAKISRHIRGVNELAALLVQNSRATINAAPAGDPLTRVRIENLRRLVKAQQKVAAAKKVQVPTVAQCHKRFLPNNGKG